MTPAAMFVKTPAHRQKIQKLLTKAIGKGNALDVKKFLAQGASPSLPDGPRMLTPLMEAASKASAELIALFLPFNDIAATDTLGRTPLHLLLQYLGDPQLNSEPAGWREALSSLLSPDTAVKKTFKGASPLLLVASRWGRIIDFNEIISMLRPFSDFSATDARGLTPTALALGCGMADASSRALALFHADPDQERCLSLPDHALGSSLAHVAVNHNCVDFLSETFPRVDLNAVDARGRTLLMASVAGGGGGKEGFSCMDFLLAKGANPLCVDDDGCDALMLGIESLIVGFNNSQWHRLIPLAQKSNLLFRDHLGESAFDKAMDRGLFTLADAIEALAGPAIRHIPVVQTGIRPTTRKKLFELLDAAIRLRRIDLVDKRLFQGADPQAHDDHSALMLACIFDSEEIIRRLIPVSDLRFVNSYGNTALTFFLESKAIDSPQRLLLMAELLSPEPTANDMGCLPLGLARPTPEFFSATMDLLGSPDDWSALSARGETILDFHGDQAQTHALAILAAHPDPNLLLSLLNHEGQTVFHLAAKAAFLPFLTAAASQERLVALDFTGHTPLMSACAGMSHGDLFPVVALLAPWSDCCSVDYNGCDALMLAIESAFADCDDLLETVQILAPLSDLETRDFLGESALDKALARGFERSAGALRARLAIYDERETLATATLASSADALPTRVPVRI